MSLLPHLKGGMVVGYDFTIKIIHHQSFLLTRDFNKSFYSVRVPDGIKLLVCLFVCLMVF